MYDFGLHAVTYFSPKSNAISGIHATRYLQGKLHIRHVELWSPAMYSPQELNHSQVKQELLCKYDASPR